MAGRSRWYGKNLPMNTRVLPAVGVALVCAACGESSNGSGEPSPPKPSRADAGDPYGSFESARPIPLGSPGILETIDGKEDKDFFSFDGRSGEWIELRSTSLDILDVFDTRITLYDENHAQLAYNASTRSLRGENVLARVITVLPGDGKYFVEIDDPEAAPVAAGFSQAYRLTVTDLSATADGYTVEDDGAAATAIRFHRWNIDSVIIDDSFLAGSFSDASDADAFAFTIDPGPEKTLSVEVQDSGVDADGSATTAGNVWVTTDTDAAVIARIDNSIGQNALTPPLDPGNYRLWVSHPNTAFANRDFYVVRAMVGPENPVEADEATNGTVGTAEALTTTNSNGTDSAFILAHVLDGDLDYFRFDGHAGASASAYCESARGGSGLVGLHVSLRDETDTTLAEATETAFSATAQGSALALENVTVPASGSLYMRTSKDGQLPDVTGNWARCAIYAQ